MVNTITFGGVLSSTYDIYISGEGVWSAPERDAEVITIPGRNGAFVQDNGRFQNITVTYPAFIVKDNNTNFKTKIDGFRNAMASKVGYQRLVDTFHTDEYRMAAFIGGLEVEPILYNDHAATFDLVFECKPQRYLTSGEIKTVVSDGDTITNPTLFASSPMIEAKGYGDIQFNGHTISLANGAIGTVNLWNRTHGGSLNGSITKKFATGQFNPTDTFSFTVSHMFTLYEDSPSIVNTNGSATNGYSDNNDGSVTYWIDLPCTFTVGTTNQTTNKSTYTFGSKKAIANMSVSYDSSTGTVVYSVTTETVNNPTFASSTQFGFTISDCNATSTLDRLGDPTYIDCDLGEAYKINGGDIVSLNSFVDLGSNLPEFAPGANLISVDNTFSEVAVVPRWWTI